MPGCKVVLVEMVRSWAKESFRQINTKIETTKKKVNFFI